jgi:hypothetical protein
MQQVAHLQDFPVIELRRYIVNAEERKHFVRYFESYFPEAFQQAGSIIFGQFLERDNRAGFTWIRGFHSMEDRATVNQAFYYGPLWKEHGAKMNERLIDHTNVLLLRPLRLERGVSVLPAVDPVSEANGAQGVAIAQIFPLNANSGAAFAQQAEAAFAGYRAAGVREAGVLITLDAENNFPPLPFRTDGPYLVWLGIVQDNRALEARFNPLAERALAALAAGGLLRGKAESVVLDPTSRSRLRWLPEARH